MTAFSLLFAYILRGRSRGARRAALKAKKIAIEQSMGFFNNDSKKNSCNVKMSRFLRG